MSALFTFKFSHGQGRGLRVFVKTDPSIERFIASLGDGTTKPLNTGYSFLPIDPETLQVYGLGNGDLRLPTFTGYTLDAFQRGLQLDNGDVNLSFLRFKGLSEGLTFGVRAVYSQAGMETLRGKIGSACRSLARDFVVPFSMKLTIYADQPVKE